MKTKHTAGRVEWVPNRIVGREGGQAVEVCSIGQIDLLDDAESERITANGERLAACWNACAGIADPETAVAELREAAQALLIQADERWPHFESERGMCARHRLQKALAQCEGRGGAA
jgi:hypothetical protein